jgi:beta-lactamase regulating signal transducer with metallopeptidase domain
MIILFAAKSVVIAAGTLLALRFMRGRSAADRSFIAHLGLAALAALPLGSMLFPPLEVTASGLPELATASSAAAWIGPFAPAARAQAAQAHWAQPAADWLLLAYAVVALFLIALMLLSLLRLVLLTARARAVTDEHWIQSMARGRLRIGITKNIALLASSDISSPLSWGGLQPKILLNTDAEAARADADAIVAHELAHVTRADWAKLVMARASVALFWFNPLAWLLAREAYQLREEAADDAVLAAEVEDMAYANLLVSAARRQSNGLLPGAHGVAPARASLAQRVRRVLDRSLNRSAGGTGWAAAMGVGAAALTVPLMTLQLADRALASSAAASFPSDDDAEVIVFDLRVPPPEPNALPKTKQRTSHGATFGGEIPRDATPASIEESVANRMVPRSNSQ